MKKKSIEELKNQSKPKWYYEWSHNLFIVWRGFRVSYFIRWNSRLLSFLWSSIWTLSSGVKKMIIDLSSNHHLQGKRFDWVKVAYIISKAGRPITANQINYYFNRMFTNSYCNTQRISQVIRAKPKYFESMNKNDRNIRITRLYNTIAIIKLNQTTHKNWENKSKKVF